MQQTIIVVVKPNQIINRLRINHLIGALIINDTGGVDASVLSSSKSTLHTSVGLFEARGVVQVVVMSRESESESGYGQGLGCNGEEAFELMDEELSESDQS